MNSVVLLKKRGVLVLLIVGRDVSSRCLNGYVGRTVQLIGVLLSNASCRKHQVYLAIGMVSHGEIGWLLQPLVRSEIPSWLMFLLSLGKKLCKVLFGRGKDCSGVIDP